LPEPSLHLVRLRRVRRLAMVALWTLLAAGAPVWGFDSAGYEKATKTILCDCGCHPQSVADCACGRAAAMREDIRKKIASGMSGEAVIAAYVAEYGEKILITPEASGFNLVAWVGPFVLLALGIAGLILLVRRWSGRLRAEAGAEPAVAVGPPADDAYASRLRREIEDLR
jgi:cytochrome c-type biogenesis protein CcmH